MAGEEGGAGGRGGTSLPPDARGALAEEGPWAGGGGACRGWAGRNQCESVPIQRQENGCTESGASGERARSRASVGAQRRPGQRGWDSITRCVSYAYQMRIMRTKCVSSAYQMRTIC
jgi:hypothetical protein